MDKEYQQKRREEMGRQPKDFGDSLARGGKGFLRVSLLLSFRNLS
jgi:vacuolar protein sorting-associated protein 13A/C